MNPTRLPALQSGKPTAWEGAIYASLVEKRRAGRPPQPCPCIGYVGVAGVVPPRGLGDPPAVR